ncbi:hypothetical protein T4B_15541 [Trichinella pseudospiralis]|uniref:Uncharacterized protein n=2 Tax=Trichinella pseudospiralis TaxID=6337 RepID=A0A0V1F691_TRIPS|nr:hypothetical protein T4D_6053 [Trichinella pseudospiralis]KRZ15287.1 hypothetical protein T4B_15541 [Trichinella pseudospiralis]KRZ37971.1 hypothetical protein T4C_1929 [Trichinella pseudospiralis]
MTSKQLASACFDSLLLQRLLHSMSDFFIYKSSYLHLLFFNSTCSTILIIYIMLNFYFVIVVRNDISTVNRLGFS